MSKSHWPDLLQPPQPTQIQAYLDSFWTDLALLADLLPRQQFLLAAEQLHTLRQTILQMMLTLNGIQRPATRDLNTYLSTNQRAALEKTLLLPTVDHESWTDIWIGQAVALVVIYRWYAPQLIAKHNLHYPHAQEQTAWETLLEHLPHLAAARHPQSKADSNRMVRHSSATSLDIVFIAPFGLRHKTTVWARTLPIAQQLVATGHTATILIPPWDSPEDTGKVETVGGVHMQQMSLAGGLPGTVRRMVQAISTAAPDIVHIVKPRAHAGIVQWWLWQRRHVLPFKIVLDVDDWEQAWNPINRYGWAVEKFLAAQEEWGIRHAHGITAASQWLTQKVTSVAPTIPTMYLPNGVDPLPEPTAPTPSHQPPQILFFTRLVEVAPEWLRAFWHETLQLLPTAELVIAGTPVQPWLAEPFHTPMRDVPQVRWTGYVPTHELRDLYAQTTCAIFPAMPIPLLQAKCSVRLATTLLHGVPVIASDVGEHTSYGADGAATLVPANATPRDFAHVVAAVVRQRDQHPHEQHTARQAATARLLQRYAWSRLVEPLPAFYAALLGQG